MSQQMSIGQASQTGPKERNEDALACVTPEPALLASKGCLFALADGVSNCANGKLAAESTTCNPRPGPMIPPRSVRQVPQHRARARANSIMA